MESIELPASLTSVNNNAFANNTKVNRMTVLATTPPDITSHTFYNIDRAIPVYVPAEAYGNYASHMYWKEFNLQRMGSTTGLGDTSSIAERITVQGSEIILHVNPDEMSEVNVFDMTGRAVLRTNETRFTIPQTGVYVVMLGQESVKVVIE